MIPLARPDIGEEEIRLVNEVLRTDWLSMGPKVGEFEEKFAHYIGTEHAIAVNSGTSGLHLCVKSIGIKKCDEVITTPFSFVASSNCVIYEGGRPIFVDIDPQTLNIDAGKIEDIINVLSHSSRIRLLNGKLGINSTAQIFELGRDLGRPRNDMWENNIWVDSINMYEDEVFFFQAIHQECIIVPENIDAIRAMMNIEKNGETSIKNTNKSLGMIKGI